MTPDEVLDLLRHNQLLLAECEEVDNADISADTCVDDWFHLSDGLTRTWVANANTLNNHFGIDVPLKS